MLNYLIGRLNDQHKKKSASVPVSSAEEVESTKAKINSDFNEFEKHLFEKYNLPPAQSEIDEDTDLDTVDSLNKVIGPVKDQTYVLTRSLYADHTQVNLDSPSGNALMSNDSLESKVKY